MSSAGKVKAINRRVVHQICSGQVVLNLSTAVKELIENSLDAGATVVEIKLREYGSELVEVVDNASGIEASNFEALTLKHHTSKLQDFSDLSSVDTFGFRGEALSSLCALSDLVITTCHKSTSVGTRIEYNHDGAIVKQTPCPRQQGTTVLLQNLFYTLPVRHKEFQRNIKKEFAKMVQLLQAYCIISNGVKITCTNQVGKGKKTPLIVTHGNTSTKENIMNIYGPKQLQTILELEQLNADTDVCEEYGLKVSDTDKNLFKISGYISKPGHGDGRSSTDRQFYFINKRPCDFLKVSKLVNEVYHMYNRHQFPFVVMDISLAKESVDVNLTPDKRKILVQEEKTLLAIIKTSLQKMFASRAPLYDINQQASSGSSAGVGGSLVAMFGRSGRKSEESSPKITLAGLKRSFSATGHTPESSREPKQPRLDTFFLKKSISDSSEMVSSSSPSSHFLKKSKSESNEMVSSSSTSLSSVLSLSSFSSPSSTQEGASQTSSSRDSALGEDTESPVDSQYSCESINSNDSKHNIDANPHESRTQAINQYSCELINSDNNKHNINSDPHESRTQAIIFERTRQSDKSTEHEDVEVKGTNIENFQQENVNKLEEFKTRNVMDIPEIYEKKDSDVLCNKTDEGQLRVGNSLQQDDGSLLIKGDGVPRKRSHRTDQEQEVSFVKKQLKVPFSFAGLKNRRRQSQKENSEGTSKTNLELNFKAKIKPSDNSAAEDELKKVFSKESFKKMEIIGQFNLGFIIGKLNSDLFIIDQHATDEKYNFEDLQKNTVLQSQRLIQPMRLELTAVNEMILRDNLEIFNKNGFEFVFDDEAPPTERVKLTSLPVSKNWTFGKEDVDEMIFMLSDAPGTMCRPSRIRQMFASRSCRKSIMIGTALNKAEMTKLVSHMADLDQPWNCPHGRPTFRHLFNLNMLPDD